MARPIRLEWISLVYLLLFVLAVISPRVVSHSYFGMSEENLEETLIFIFGMAGLGTFMLYERVMEHREHERDQALSDRDQARRELVSSYEYIGAVNRQIDALKHLANETAISLVENDRVRKDLFQSLAASAAALVHAEQAVIRIVSLDQLRTVREFHLDAQNPIRVHNRDLRATHDGGKTHAFVRSEEGHEILVVPSDRQDLTSKAFILVRTNPDQVPNVDPGMLKVYANQAEVLYRVLAGKEVETMTA
jgi:hypothetical protein